MNELRDRFRQLHHSGTFVLPNPWDVGSARILAAQGFSALATTSAGFAATLGRLDMAVSRDELVAHVAALTAAVDVPLNVDAERCFGDTDAEIAQTVDQLAAAGAAGLSIEDWDPAANRIEPFDRAVERVAVAAAAAARHGIVLTARAENHLHGVSDLNDTIRRLAAFGEAGAEVVYAPGLTSPDDIARVVAESGRPVNVLALRGAPTVAELAALGVRRVSTGGSLALAAYGAMARAAQELADTGTYGFLAGVLDGSLRRQAMAPLQA